MREIVLTKGKVAIVDDSDYEWLNQWKWYAQACGNRYYAARRNGRKNGHKLLLMHRVVLDAPPSKDVDHVNGNTLDCRRSNLRLCTESQNLHNRGKVSSRNTSGYKGVYPDRPTGKWRTRIMVNRKIIELGLFETPEAAAEAYKKAAIKHVGEFSHSSL